ncbi:MAG: hypothetical protein Fur0046_10000 [Cyanobacteria bacterium J069]|nr:MAG: hypothetical protein D6742_09310 [Cyanobacteria bacterium J069]
MIANGGGNVNQAGGNVTTTTTTNYNFVFFIIGLVALGGLAWALNLGNIQGGNSGQTTAPPVTSPTASPE